MQTEEKTHEINNGFMKQVEEDHNTKPEEQNENQEEVIKPAEELTEAKEEGSAADENLANGNGGVEEAEDGEAEDEESAKRKRSDSQPGLDDDNDAKRALTESEEANTEPATVDYAAHLTQLYQTAGEFSAIPGGLAAPVTQLAVSKTETMADGQIKELIDCPQDKVGSLIGTRGAVIQDMQTRCGCKIYIDQNFPEGMPRKIILTGSRLAVDHAKQLIALVMQDGPTVLHMLQGPVVEQTIDCAQHLVGRVIGANGGTIRDLQSRCGCKIQIDQNFPEGHPRKISFTGSAEAVALGIQTVQQVMEHGPAGALVAPGMPQSMGGMQQYGVSAPAGGAPGIGPAPGGQPAEGVAGPGIPQPTRDGAGTIYPPTPLGNGMQHQIIECAKVLVGRIIGRGGETINLIQQKSQCRVQIDQQVPEGVPCKVNMQGSPQAVQLAADLVQEVMSSGPGRLHFMPSLQPMAATGYYGYGAQQMYGYGQGGYPQAQGYAAQQPYQGQYGTQAGGYPQTGYAQAGQQQQYQQPVAAPAAASSGGAAQIWSEHATEDGNKYWYNSQTGQSQWERPAGL